MHFYTVNLGKKQELRGKKKKGEKLPVLFNYVRTISTHLIYVS